MSKKEKTDIAIAIIVVLVALAFILTYTFTGDTSFMSGKAISQTELSEMQIEDNVYYKADEKEILKEEGEEESSHSTDEVVQEEVEEKTQEIDSTFKDQGLDKSHINDIQKREATEFSDSISSNKVFDFNDARAESKDNIEIKSANRMEEDKEMGNVSEAEKKKEVPEAKDCIIIIGSFSKNKNVNNIKTNLTKDGYDIFETPYKGLNRIGVYLPCKSDILSRELSKIRKKYAEDAFIFKRG